MKPPYQIPDSVGVPKQLNKDIATVQETANVAGMRATAFGRAYQAIISSYPGDPEAGKLIPGTKLAYNDATQVQRDIYDALQIAGKLDNIYDTLVANPGPTGDGEWWNWSYTAWGLNPNGAADKSLKTTSILVNDGGNISTVTGIEIPSN